MTKKDFLKIVEQEGDHYKWIHNGVQCFIRRCRGNLHWCGYILLEEKHLYFNVEDICDINVHGGVTYNSITDDNLYQIGFDCNHSDDFGLMALKYPDIHMSFSKNATYKTKQFVIDETNKMCDQLCKIKPKYIRDDKLKDILLN